ncbi:MAG: hypothetical protein HC905_08190 [Bacteroidales bacterium]|nr:hypothetical protein [Bacteroidales bacterium]
MSNVGEIKFWGYEFVLSTINIDKNVKWTSDLNVSLHRSKVVDLGRNRTYIGGDNDYGEDWHRTEVGKPMGVFYGYVFDGVFMNQAELDRGPRYADSDANRHSMVGSVRMKDINGPNGIPDGIITRHDRTQVGDPNPDFLFGFTNNLSYKKWDFSISMVGQVGGDLVWRSLEYSYNLDGAFNMDKNC